MGITCHRIEQASVEGLWTRGRLPFMVLLQEILREICSENQIREKRNRQSLKLRKAFCVYGRSADNAAAILADDTGLGYLRKRHHNRACHLLYPLSTTDGIAAEFDMTYMSTTCETHRKLSWSAFGECQALCGEKKKKKELSQSTSSCKTGESCRFQFRG